MGKTKIDKNLRDLIAYFHEMMVPGMVEQGQQEVIERCINNLRRAVRSGTTSDVRRALDKLAQSILRTR